MKANYSILTSKFFPLFLALLLFSTSNNTFAQKNIAPQAVVTSNRAQSGTFAPSGLNDLNFGTCGTQQVWLSSSSPPSTTIGVDWIQFDWAKPVQFNEMIIHHGQTNTRFLSGGTMQYWNGSSWVTFHIFTNLPQVCVNSVPFKRVRTQRMRITAWETKGSQRSNPNFREIEIIEAPEFHNDAGISDLVSPGIPVCSRLDSILTAEVRNFAIKPMDSCLVNWMLNDSMMTGAKFLQQLNPGATGTVSIVSYRNFVLGDTIKIWTSMPNGVRDSMPENDTLQYVLIDGLSGIYSVGGSFADFANIDSAINAVNLKGICGNVVMELNNGSHTPTIELMQFYGGSPNSTLTFTSASNDRAQCAITDTSTTNGNNFAMILNGADWVVFDELTLSNGSQGQYSGVLKFENGTHGIHIKNCLITNNYSGTSNNGALIFNDESDYSNLTIEDCHLDSGSVALALIGNSDNIANNIGIEDNVFSNQSRGSIFMSFASDYTLRQNTFSSNSSRSNAKAVVIEDTENGASILNNRVNGSVDWPLTAFEILKSKGNRNNSKRFINNIITIGDTSGTSDYAAVSILESDFWLIAHNTITVNGGSTDAYVLEVDDGTGNDVINNVVTCFGSGQAVVYDEVGSVSLSEGNSLYSETGSSLGSYLGTAYLNLSDWQNNSGFDKQSSSSSDPQFYDRFNGDFRMCSPQADNTGLAIGVMQDFSGSTRSTTTPDPGAYEFASVQGLSIDDESICNGDTAFFSASVGAADTVVWNGSTQAQSFSTTQAGQYTVRAFGFCGSVTDTFEVVINPDVTLDSDHNLCFGEDTMINASITNANYKWNTGASTQGITVDRTGQYFVEVIDTDGCVSADTINITVSGTIDLGPDQKVCENTPVELDPQGGAGNYVWRRNGNSLPSASKIFADSAGTYSVEFTDPYGCVSIDTVTIVHDQAPVATFTMKTRTAQTQNNFEFIADYKNGSNYYWSFGDGQSVNGPAWKTVNVYQANGSYTVRLTVSSEECGDSTFSRTVVIEGVGLNEVSHNGSIRVYPNPNNGTFTLQSASIDLTKASIQIISIDGKSSMDLSSNDPSLLHIDSPELVQGVYLLNIRHSSGVGVFRFIVE